LKTGTWIPVGKTATAGVMNLLASQQAKDRVFMKDDQLMVSKNGVSTKVNKSITLKDGTVILANGTVKMPDGNTMKLKNGESISLSQKPASPDKSKQ